MNIAKYISIIRYDKNNFNQIDDLIIREYPLTIFLNGEEFLTLLCSPKNVEYLVYGFLYSEGIILKKDDITNVTIEKDKGFAYVELKNRNQLTEALHGKRIMTTGCGKGSTFYNVLDLVHLNPVPKGFYIEPEQVLELSMKLNKESKTFIETGGVHSCCLCEGNNILIMHEDVGRHNAVDKIVGEALLKEIPLHDKVMVTSGRISSEMLLKCAKVQIPIVISRSAPTELAVREAIKLDVTIIGFARGSRMNIYSHAERVLGAK